MHQNSSHIPSPRRLSDQVAIVTGASRNIGAAISLRLAAEGAAVAINYRSPGARESAERVLKECEAAGGRGIALQADVDDERQVEAMVETVATRLGPPTLLVNNAAASVTADRPWTEPTVEEWDRVMRTNATGGFICSRAVAGLMGEVGYGSIVNISSVRAIVGATGNLHYATSKAAQLGFTRALAAELGPRGIRVNAVIVGAILTPDEELYGPPEEVSRRVIASQMLPMRGLPEDVAATAAFLCSHDARFVTGASIVVDGGFTAR